MLSGCDSVNQISLRQSEHCMLVDHKCTPLASSHYNDKLCLLIHNSRVGHSPQYLSQASLWHPITVSTCIRLWCSMIAKKEWRESFLHFRTSHIEASTEPVTNWPEEAAVDFIIQKTSEILPFYCRCDFWVWPRVQSYWQCKSQYTPPTPTQLNCGVELHCVGGVYWIHS